MGTPRRRFGQHFLRDQSVIAKMLSHIAPKVYEHIIEIGPGNGALTFSLLEAGANVTAVEIDRDLAKRLRQTKYAQPIVQGEAVTKTESELNSPVTNSLVSKLVTKIESPVTESVTKIKSESNPYGTKSPQNKSARLIIIEGDVLQQDLRALVGGLRVVGNLPYNISTPLLIRLAQTASPEIWVMVQKEVGQRAAAIPGGSQYGRLSVSLQFSHDVDFVLPVPPQAFSPPPKVESAVLRICRRSSFLPAPPNFAAVVNAAFQSRRKILANGLSAFAVDWQKANVDSARRPQTLSPQEFAAVASAVQNPQK